MVLGTEQPTPATLNGPHPGLSGPDIYPAGYTTFGKRDERLGKDREEKERKRRKDKGSPPTHTTDDEHAVLTVKDSPLLATPLVATRSASPHIPGFFEVNGVNSTTLSPGMSPTKIRSHSQFLEWTLLHHNANRCRFRPSGTNLPHANLPTTPTHNPRLSVHPPNPPQRGPI